MNRKLIDKAVSFTEANNMVTDGDGIVVGVSGGADSVCLLFLLCELRKKYALRLHVVHVHHGIRKEAGDDAAYVEKLCNEWDVPCDVIKKDVPALACEWKMSEEEAGRKVRYDAFAEVAHICGYKKIAVAHNMNDEAETVLFHMFRGSGLHGLTGMPAVRDMDDLKVIRPILCLNREEIESVLDSENIEWVTDKTNLEDKYARNRIRHNILPEADGVAPGAVKHICDAAAQLAETESFLEEMEMTCLSDCRVNIPHREDGDAKRRDDSKREGDIASWSSDSDKEIILDAIKLAKYHAVIKKRAILTCLKEITGGGKDIGSLQVNQVLDLIDRPGNREINLARGISARRSYDKVVMYTAEINALTKRPYGEKYNVCDNELGSRFNVNIEYMTSGEKGIDIEELLETVCKDNELNKYTKWLDYDRIDGQLDIRSRKSGDFLMVQNASGEYHRKSLKDYMIDMKIPASKRDDIPVVACGSHCVWVVGYRISDYCKISQATQRVVRLSCTVGGEH